MAQDLGDEKTGFWVEKMDEVLRRKGLVGDEWMRMSFV